MPRTIVTLLVGLLLTAPACGSPKSSNGADQGAQPSSPDALARPPAVGDRLPMFELPGHDGSQVALADRLAKGPVVLVFYRGHW